MSTSVTIRKFEAQDLEAVVRLLDELNAFEGYDVVTDAMWLRLVLHNEHGHARVESLVAVDEGSLVGVVLYYSGYDTLSASFGYHVADLVVTHTHRRQGIGKGLFAAIAQQALQSDHRWMALTVLRRNEAAQKFYQALGLSKIEVNLLAMGESAMRALSE